MSGTRLGAEMDRRFNDDCRTSHLHQCVLVTKSIGVGAESRELEPKLTRTDHHQVMDHDLIGTCPLSATVSKAF